MNDLSESQCEKLDQILSLFGDKDSLEADKVLAIEANERKAKALIDLLVRRRFVTRVGEAIGHVLPFILNLNSDAELFIDNGGFLAEFKKQQIRFGVEPTVINIHTNGHGNTINTGNHASITTQSTVASKESDPEPDPYLEVDHAKEHLPGYLHRIVDKYRWLKLQDLREAGSLQIELEKVYIALKAEPESEYDLQQSSKLHETEILDEAGVGSTDVITPLNLENFESRNIRLTYRPVRDEAKRARITEVHTFGDAFRQHHRIIVLGGPGSGKTTLGRWLTLQLAKAHAIAIKTKAKIDVSVLRFQIDPDVSAESKELANLGPSRIPVFLRLAHYARELASRDRDGKPAISLINYLGRDPDSEELGDHMTADTRNQLFREHIEISKDVVVILDGLDELSEANRGTVVSKVQDFIREYIPETDPDGELGLPFENGGNQVVVTSRYVGYKYHPIRANCAHFGVQPMSRPAVERFVRAWCGAVNTELRASGLKGVDAHLLISEIYNINKPKVRELATNPLLITILATVYWRDGKLPDQRAGIYDRIIESLVEVWLKREECKRLKREQLMAALEPLAADLQENASNNGLVSLARIAEIIEGPLAHVTGIDDPGDRRFREQLDGLLETIRKHVGLLAEQSAGNYAFFHRTFQEFLAARHLLSKRATAAQRMIEKLDDPIWREPLLLALGFVMLDWERESQIQLLTSFLANDEQDVLIPRATFLLTDALLEIHKVPNEIVEQMVFRLLTAYSTSMEHTHAHGLRERIEQMFTRLRKGSQTNVVTRLLAEAIRRPGEQRDFTFAIANIVRQIDWYTDEIVDALMLAVGRDRNGLECPICQSLIKALNPKLNEQRWIDTASRQTISRLESAHLPMRKLLKMRPELVAFVREDPDWLALLIVLYGGLDQAVSLADLDPYLQQPIEAATSAAFKSPFPLDKKEVFPLVLPQLNFSPTFIFWDIQDVELGRLVQRHLSQQQPARKLVEIFRNRWENGNEVGAVEALVGLAALGEDIIPILRDSLDDPDGQNVVQTIFARFGRLRFLLNSPILRTSEMALRTIPENVPEQHQLDLLHIVLKAHIACGGAPLQIGVDWPVHNFISSNLAETKASLDAEFWAYIFSGAAGDGRTMDILAAVTGTLAISNSDRLLNAWSQIPYAVNRTARHHLSWAQPILTPRTSSQVERYLAMLDAMETVPAEYHVMAGYILAQCRSILDRNEFLLRQTIAICERLGQIFTRGYQMNRTSFWDKTARLQILLEQELILIATAQKSAPRMETSFEEDSLDKDIKGNSTQYLLSRAIETFPDFLKNEENARKIVISKSINDTSNPIDRISAIEFLLICSPKLLMSSTGQNNLIDAVIDLLPEIRDPENRARTLFRLAIFIPVQADKLLSEAIDALRAIVNPVNKALAINEVRLVLGREPTVAAALDRVAETISSSWERNKALERISNLVLTCLANTSIPPLCWRLSQTSGEIDRVFRKGFANGTLPWTLIFLFYRTEEIEKLGTVPLNLDALWDRLLDNPSEAVTSLIAAGMETSLPITVRNASILDRALQKEGTNELEPLWAYLGRPEPGALATILRWSFHSGRPNQWSALVQAEAGKLNPEIVSSVIDLFANANGLLRLRASLALHGPTAHTENPLRRWRISRVGADTANTLAQEATRSSNSQAMLTTLGWVRHDIHHDDPKAVEKWLVEATEEGEHSPSAWLIAGMESADEEVVSVLLSALPNTEQKTQEIILKALARLSYCSKGLGLPSGDIHKVIAAVPAGIRIRLSILSKGIETLLNSVQEAVKETSSGPAWQKALMLMDKSSEWLDEVSLGSREDCIKRLRAIGAEEYIRAGNVRAGDADFDSWKGPYWANADKAAMKLIQDERIQETLITLLAEMGSTKNYLGYTNHLLTATEAVARRSPDGFARLASPNDWEPLFTEWAQYSNHWSERLAAVRLLGRLRRVTPRVAQALRAAMEDNPYTQHAAYATVGEFRHIDGNVFHDILSMLDNSNAATAAAAAKLLVSASMAGIDVETRRRIINSLQETVKKASASRPIFLMEGEDSGTMHPKFTGNLEEILYRSIFEMSGS